MHKSDARKIAEVITFEQLTKMFMNAKASIADWEEVSIVNKTITKGTAWNILYPALNPGVENHTLIVRNMIRELGEYLPEELKPKKPLKDTPLVKLVHEEPIF